MAQSKFPLFLLLLLLLFKIKSRNGSRPPVPAPPAPSQWQSGRVCPHKFLSLSSLHEGKPLTVRVSGGDVLRAPLDIHLWSVVHLCTHSCLVEEEHEVELCADQQLCFLIYGTKQLDVWRTKRNLGYKHRHSEVSQNIDAIKHTHRRPCNNLNYKLRGILLRRGSRCWVALKTQIPQMFRSWMNLSHSPASILLISPRL